MRFVLVAGAVYLAATLALAVWHVARLDDAGIRNALTRPVLHVRYLPGREDGRAVEVLGCVCDRTLRADEVPEVARHALVATEDRRFHDHPGIDLRAIGRALVVNLRNAALDLSDGGRRGREGGSTLSQQLAKVALTGSRGGLYRKLAEALYAVRIERLYDKDDILRLYLSRVEFGRVGGVAIYGLRDAAKVYFGTRPDRLTLEQAAILVGMLNATTDYHPIRNPAASARRAALVLDRMRTQGVLPRAPAADIAALLPEARVETPLRHRYLEDLLAAQFGAIAGRRDFPGGLYRVVSTIDPIAQYRALQFTIEEVARAGRANVARAALVSLDRDGRVLALVGDVNYLRSTFNIATRGRRQSASTAKVATYLAALEAGWGPEDIVRDDRAALRGPFRPRNADGRYKGDVPLETCLRESRNVCTYWLAEQVGFDAVAEMAGKTGLTFGQAPGASVVLGASESSPLKTATVFAALANGGDRVTPKALSVILGPLGVVRHVEVPERVPLGLKPATVATMRALLRQVVTDGTGQAARFVGADAFGKTGTSQFNRDAWFAGFTSDDVTTVVWVGPPEDETMRGVSGGDLPARIFRRFNLSLVDRFHAYGRGDPLPR